MPKNKEFKKQEDEMVEEPVPTEEQLPEEASEPEKVDVSELIDELQDLMAELTDIVTQLAQSVKATAEVKEGISESIKSMKEEIVKELKDFIKDTLDKPEVEDKKRQADWEKKPTDVKPSGEGEEVKVPEPKLNEMAPGKQTLQEAMNVAKAAERPVDVQKGAVQDENVDVIDAILKGEVKGIADLRRFRKA